MPRPWASHAKSLGIVGGTATSGTIRLKFVWGFLAVGWRRISDFPDAMARVL